MQPTRNEWNIYCMLNIGVIEFKNWEQIQFSVSDKVDGIDLESWINGL